MQADVWRNAALRQIDQSALLPEEAVPAVVRTGFTSAEHLPSIVDVDGITVVSAQRSQIRHATVSPKVGVFVPRLDAVADRPAQLIDADRLAERQAQRVQIGVPVTPPRIGVVSARTGERVTHDLPDV